jgi:hypothetical protein
MAQDAIKRALARRPKLPPIEETLRVPPPRTNLVANQPHWEPSVRDGVAVKGWVFNVTVDKSDPHGHDYFYEFAYELDGDVHVSSRTKGMDPWDWRFTGPYGDWFHETVMECRAATVLLHPERDPVLFGDTEPFEILRLGDQVARARRAAADRRAKETEYALEILQEASTADRRGVATLLAPFASAYTQRTHDDFYIVADLYSHARNGGDVLTILERIAPELPAASKRYWAAE